MIKQIIWTQSRSRRMSVNKTHRMVFRQMSINTHLAIDVLHTLHPISPLLCSVTHNVFYLKYCYQHEPSRWLPIMSCSILSLQHEQNANVQIQSSTNRCGIVMSRSSILPLLLSWWKKNISEPCCFLIVMVLTDMMLYCTVKMSFIMLKGPHAGLFSCRYYFNSRKCKCYIANNSVISIFWGKTIENTWTCKMSKIILLLLLRGGP